VDEKVRTRHAVSVKKKGRFEFLKGSMGTADLEDRAWSAPLNLDFGCSWASVLSQRDVFFATGALELKVDCWFEDQDSCSN